MTSTPPNIDPKNLDKTVSASSKVDESSDPKVHYDQGRSVEKNNAEVEGIQGGKSDVVMLETLTEESGKLDRDAPKVAANLDNKKGNSSDGQVGTSVSEKSFNWSNVKLFEQKKKPRDVQSLIDMGVKEEPAWSIEAIAPSMNTSVTSKLGTDSEQVIQSSHEQRRGQDDSEDKMEIEEERDGSNKSKGHEEAFGSLGMKLQDMRSKEEQTKGGSTEMMVDFEVIPRLSDILIIKDDQTQIQIQDVEMQNPPSNLEKLKTCEKSGSASLRDSAHPSNPKSTSRFSKEARSSTIGSSNLFTGSDCHANDTITTTSSQKMRTGTMDTKGSAMTDLNMQTSMDISIYGTSTVDTEIGVSALPDLSQSSMNPQMTTFTGHGSSAAYSDTGTTDHHDSKSSNKTSTTIRTDQITISEGTWRREVKHDQSISTKEPHSIISAVHDSSTMHSDEGQTIPHDLKSSDETSVSVETKPATIKKWSQGRKKGSSNREDDPNMDIAELDREGEKIHSEEVISSTGYFSCGSIQEVSDTTVYEDAVATMGEGSGMPGGQAAQADNIKATTVQEESKKHDVQEMEDETDKAIAEVQVTKHEGSQDMAKPDEIPVLMKTLAVPVQESKSATSAIQSDANKISTQDTGSSIREPSDRSSVASSSPGVRSVSFKEDNDDKMSVEEFGGACRKDWSVQVEQSNRDASSQHTGQVIELPQWITQRTEQLGSKSWSVGSKREVDITAQPSTSSGQFEAKKRCTASEIEKLLQSESYEAEREDKGSPTLESEHFSIRSRDREGKLSSSGSETSSWTDSSGESASFVNQGEAYQPLLHTSDTSSEASTQTNSSEDIHAVNRMQSRATYSSQEQSSDSSSQTNSMEDVVMLNRRRNSYGFSSQFDESSNSSREFNPHLLPSIPEVVSEESEGDSD